jgi:hypothetical protein
MEVRCKRFVIATQFPRTIICAVLVDRRIHSIDVVELSSPTLGFHSLESAKLS